MAGTAPLGKSVPLAAGAHDLEVSAVGFTPFRARVTVAAGQELSQPVALAGTPVALGPSPAAGSPESKPPLPPTLVSDAPTEPSPRPAAPLLKKWWFWAGVAGAIGVGVATALVVSRGGAVTPACPPEISRCQRLP